MIDGLAQAPVGPTTVIVSDGRIEALERGMTPMQAIQSASSIAATHMGWSDRVGAMVPGRYGDLIAVRCDPLEDVSCLQAVDVVVKGGLVFRQPGPER